MANTYGRAKPTQATLDNPTLPRSIAKYTYILAEVKPPHRSGRRCKCGTVLSIYTAGKLCNICKRKQLRIEDMEGR